MQDSVLDGLMIKLLQWELVLKHSQIFMDFNNCYHCILIYCLIPPLALISYSMISQTWWSVLGFIQIFIQTVTIKLFTVTIRLFRDCHKFNLKIEYLPPYEWYV